ncbi:MAG TPA: 30S ribosomal protein S16 [Polyangia bacterium]|jgi:small subunit ribosomal protein S16|nr:30S ribosomal protein S16 [Polyangia bacterium]
MSVTIRLTRAGSKKVPFYRVVAADSRSPRDGRFIEQLGVYDPLREPPEFRIKAERVQYWISHGALPSQTVGELLNVLKKTAAAAEPPVPAKPAAKTGKTPATPPAP